MAIASSISYPINYVMNIVNSNKISKFAADQAIIWGKASNNIKLHNNLLLQVVPSMAQVIKTQNYWLDGLKLISLSYRALNAILAPMRLSLDAWLTDLRAFIPSLRAAFNFNAGVASIDMLNTQLAPFVQNVYQVGESWNEVTNAVSDNAARVGVLVTDYANLANQVSQYAKYTGDVAGITNAVTSMGLATGQTIPQIALLTTETAKFASSTQLISSEVKTYTEGLVALSNKLGVTTEGILTFSNATAGLVRNNTLNATQVAAYGSAFEQLGVQAQTASGVFNRLVSALTAPDELFARGEAGLNQLGFTAEEVSNLMQDSADKGLTTFLKRVQEIAATDPQRALGAIKDVLGGAAGGNVAQQVLLLANNLGLVGNSLSILNDAGNGELVDALNKITKEANPVMTLANAFAGLTNTLGTILNPVLTDVNLFLASIVDALNNFLIASRDNITPVLNTLAEIRFAFRAIAFVLRPVLLAWGAYNTVLISVKAAQWGVLQLANLLPAQYVAVKTALLALSGQLQQTYNFMQAKLIPIMIQFGKESLQAIRYAFTKEGIKVINDWATALWRTTGTRMPMMITSVAKNISELQKIFETMLGTVWQLLKPMLPYILLIAGAFLAVNAAVRTFKSVNKPFTDLKDSMSAVSEQGKRLDKTLKQISDAEFKKPIEGYAGALERVRNAAHKAMEFIREYGNLIGLVGRVTGNETLKQFQFSTAAEATANNVKAAYSDAISNIESYASRYREVTNKLRDDPTNYLNIRAGEEMVGVLKEQIAMLEKMELAKGDQASRDIYIKSLEQEIRQINALSVGNEAYADSIDQSTVAIEDMEKALDNLRSNVSDELKKQNDEEIKAMQDIASAKEEAYKNALNIRKDEAKARNEIIEDAIDREQELEDNAINRKQELEDNAIQANIDAREASIAKQQESEDKAVESRYNAEDAAIEKREATEDKAIEKRHAKEDKALEAKYAAEDSALDAKYAKEDKALDAKYAKEDKALEAKYTAEDKLLDAKYAKEDKALDAKYVKEDKALDAVYAKEDKAIDIINAKHDALLQARLDKQVAALTAQSELEIQTINKAYEERIKIIEEAANVEISELEKRLEIEQAAVNAIAAQREDVIKREQAKAENELKLRLDSTVEQQAKRLQADLNRDEAAFNTAEQNKERAFKAQIAQAEQAFNSQLQRADAKHKSKMQALEATAASNASKKAEEELEKRKSKELGLINEAEAKVLQQLEREQELRGKSSEEQKQLEQQWALEDAREAEKEQVKQQYAQQRQNEEEKLANIAKGIQESAADNQEAVQKQKEEAEAKYQEERKKKEDEFKAYVNEQELKYEASANERKLAFEEQLNTKRAENELKLNELKLVNEQQLAELKRQQEIELMKFRAEQDEIQTQAKLALEKQIAERKEALEKQITAVKLEQDKATEARKFEAEAKINELKQRFEDERLKLEETREQEKAKRDEQREAEKVKRDEAREQEKVKRDEQREAEKAKLEESKEREKAKLEESRVQEKVKREETREAEKAKREIERENAKEARELKREAEAEARAEKREQAKEVREEEREKAKEAREVQREEARKLREQQDEQAAYQLEQQREAEAYEREKIREEEKAARAKTLEDELNQLQQKYEQEELARRTALEDEIAAKNKALEQELAILKLSTQQAIEQSYSNIVEGLKASAAAISAAAAAANAAASGSGKGSKGGSVSGAKGRYLGGRVFAGLPYWVGENKRTGQLTPDSELFIPDTSGYIANASQVWGMIRAANRLATAHIASSQLSPKQTDTATAALAKELSSIRRDVSKLTATVNVRTNALRVGDKQPKTNNIYKIN